MSGNANERMAPLLIALALLVAFAMAATSCNGGLRPTLVDDPPPTPQPPLELKLLPAPDGTPPLPSAADDFPLEASVDDALQAWATDRNIPYLDSCTLVNPGEGQLCDVATERETVRLLGPSASEIWYVVTVAGIESFDFGTGYRVARVSIAGD